MNIEPGGRPLLGIKLTLRWDPAYKHEQVEDETIKGLKSVGENWAAETMPGHFELPAMLKYGYAPRSARYMKRKARVKHHQRPLVYSRALETSAKAAHTLKFAGHNKIRMRLSIWGGLPDRRRELFATTMDENAVMMMTLRSYLLRFLRMPTSSALQAPAGAGFSAAGG